MNAPAEMERHLFRLKGVSECLELLGKEALLTARGLEEPKVERLVQELDRLQFALMRFAVEIVDWTAEDDS